jgi:putative ABC transport system ATP-binding protein
MTNSLALDDPRPLAVSAEGVVKTYERGSMAARVLDGVDLHVERGRSVFLAGPSGSGKTTLLSILGCILSADEGRVNILGQDLSGLSPRQRSDFT